jgi:hypothetical protein
MGHPDFLIIGAMKCGTSTLQAQLAVQPGIFMTDPKEPNYFSDDSVHALGPEWYEALFAQAAPGDLTGEASTHYTKLPTYPQTLARMRAALPSPRLVYILRDPIERAVSHYLHERSLDAITPDFREALRVHPELIEYGRYGMQIAPYLEVFGSESIHLTSLERLTADPEGELRRVAAFIGYGRTPDWQHDLGRQNVSAERVRPLPFHDLIVGHPAAIWLRRTFVPKSLRNRIRESRTIKTRPEIPDDLRGTLEAVFLEDRGLLASQFPGHAVLADCYPFAPA